MFAPRSAVISAVVALLAGGGSAAAAVAVLRAAPTGNVFRDELIAVAAGFTAMLLLTALTCWLCRLSFQRFERRLVAQADAGGREELASPFWMRSVSRMAAVTAQRWADRCEELQSAVREVEIRHRVTEAERQHIETILHSLRDAVLVTDGFDEVTMANTAAEKLFGFDLEASTGRSLDTIIWDEELRRLITMVRASGVPNKQKHVEHTVENDDGAFDFDATLVCLPDARHGVAGVVTILRDITREKEISQMKSDFVSQASHELRTPLSSINAYVEMLVDGETADEETRQEFYGIIKAESERVSRMVDNMLNISRIEAGIISAEWVEVDFVKVCEEVVETLTPQARMKRTALSVKAGPLVYTAQADRDMVYQVVMNLVSNAIKYTPEGGRVTVSIENDDASRSVLVNVVDTGLGIPPEAKDRIFEKFFRVKSYRRVAQGTGLGLNLVRRIVETVHHGCVGVDSEVGMGSRFWFTVPYRNESVVGVGGGMAA